MLSVLLALAVLLASPWSSPAKLLEPMVVGWEQIFKLDWQVRERKGRRVVAGTLHNDSPYHVTKIQLLVEGIDDKDTILSQRVEWAGAGDIGPFGHMYFEVPPPKPAGTTYRVRVFWYDRIEIGTGHGSIQIR